MENTIGTNSSFRSEAHKRRRRICQRMRRLRQRLENMHRLNQTSGEYSEIYAAFKQSLGHDLNTPSTANEERMQQISFVEHRNVDDEEKENQSCCSRERESMVNMVSNQVHVVAEQQQANTNANGNSLQLRVFTEHLYNLLQSDLKSKQCDFYSVCISLTCAIDCAVASNEVPPNVHDLPPLLKQVYGKKNEPFLQPAIMVLMISIKNACRSGWFRVTDTDELLALANEISSFFCSSGNFISEPSNTLQIITQVMPRFYPRMRIGHILVSVEAKPGYEILVTDFSIPKHMMPAPQERIRLFVAQTDNLDTSSCIISPPQVSFLLNGWGVGRRTNVSMDSSPQLPTDVTGLIKLGANLLQVIGHFNGRYIIAVVFMTIVSSHDTPQLQDYVQPVITSASDDEVIEGPSRISLHCPISYKRIRTPVKGYLCRHHQCFDYENFMEMNLWKPLWRCPHCNQPVCCTDLRIDQKMVQVLGEVGEDVLHALITADGSWEIISENAGNTDHSQSDSAPIESKRGHIVDLTVEESYESNGNNSTVNGNNSTANGNTAMDSDANRNARISMSETEDRKPSQDILRGFSGTENLSETLVVTGTSVGTDHGGDLQLLQNIWSGILFPPPVTDSTTAPIFRSHMHRLVSESFPISSIMHDPVLTDAVSSTPNREAADAQASIQPSTSFQIAPHVRSSLASEGMHLQHSNFGTSVITGETEESPFSRLVSYSPIAIQALAAQVTSSIQRPRTNILDSNPIVPNGSPSSFNSARSDIERLQLSSRQQTDPPSVPDPSSSSSLQLHSIAQHQQNEKFQHGVQHQNQSFQQVVGFPAISQVGVRTAPEQQRIRTRYSGPSGRSQDLLRPLNPLTVLQNTKQHAIAQMASQHAAQMARPVQLQAPRAGLPYPMNGDAVRMSMSVDQRWNPGSARPMAHPRSESALIEIAPSEENWRPTGLMRGSLARHPNNPAFTQVLAQQAQAQSQTHTEARSAVVSASLEQLPVLATNSINAHQAPQSYPRSGDLNRHGRSSIPHQRLEDKY